MSSKSLKDALEYQKASIKREAEKAKAVRDLCKKLNLDKYVTALVAAEPNAGVFVGTYGILINVPVKSMKHMLEVIEAAEACMGIEFDKTEDSAGCGERHFRSSAEWRITIIGRVPLEDTEGQTCRRVQTGTETREYPTYKLECTE